MLASVGIGGLVLLPLRDRLLSLPVWIEVTLAYFLGQALIASVLLCLALTGRLRFVEVTASLAVGSVGLIAYLWRTQAFSFALRADMRSLGNAIPLSWKLVTVAAAAVTVRGFTTLGSSVSGDAIAYYMVVPKVVAYSGKLILLPGYEAFSVGVPAEMLLAALTCLGMPNMSPRIYSWFNFLPMIMLFAGLAGQCGLAVRGRILAVVIPLTSSAVLVLWGSGKTDLFALGPALCAAVLALASWEKRGREIAVGLSGLFVGFATVFKLSYMLPLVPALAVMIVWRDLVHFWHQRRDGMRKAALVLFRSICGTAVRFSFAFVCGLTPFLIQSFALHGNIVGPEVETTAWFSPATTFRLLATYPLALTYGRYWAQFGTLSPLVIGLLPFLIYLPRLREWSASKLAALSVGTAIGLIAWIALLPAVFMPRYFLANLLMLGVPAAAAGEAFSRRGRWHSRLVAVASLVALAAIPAQVNAQWFPSFDITSTAGVLRDPADDLLGAGGFASYAHAHHAINALAAPGDRVFLLSYYRYWLRPDLIASTNSGAELGLFVGSTRPSEPLSRDFWTVFQAGGYHFLLLDTNIVPKAKEFLDHIPPGVKARVVFSEGVLAAYEIAPSTSAEP